MSRASQASTSIDRTQAYFAKPERRMRPDFARQVQRGSQMQTNWPWHKRRPRTNPDQATENRA